MHSVCVQDARTPVAMRNNGVRYLSYLCAFICIAYLTRIYIMCVCNCNCKVNICRIYNVSVCDTKTVVCVDGGRDSG